MGQSRPQQDGGLLWRDSAMDEFARLPVFQSKQGP
jgi:hypothetical protein